MLENSSAYYLAFEKVLRLVKELIGHDNELRLAYDRIWLSLFILGKRPRNLFRYKCLCRLFPTSHHTLHIDSPKDLRKRVNHHRPIL